MDPKERLLARLDGIALGLQESGSGLALIALGSVGRELERIDAYSDLDFFAIVRPGCKTKFLSDLTWLEKPASLAYFFQNTPDGFKLLYTDGILAEMAVFEPTELEKIPFAPGRIVWQADDFDPSLAEPRPHPAPAPHSLEWSLGEALTCLLVGMYRYRRGEKLSAQRFIQHFAVDRILELAARIEPEQPAHRDPFNLERRFEQRFPLMSAHLPDFVQGYQRSPESAQAILAFLEKHFEVNPTLHRSIMELIEDHQADPGILEN